MNDLLTLCATTRLAQTLRAERPAGQAVWRTPAASNIAQWLAALAEEAALTGIADLPLALDAYAERVLWEKVIAESLADAADFFDLSGMAASAADAHALCREWNLQPQGEGISGEAQLFLGWQAEFERRCKAGGWLDVAGVQRQVVALIEAGHFALPARVAFAGFDRPTPFEIRLREALAARGVAVEDVAAGAPAPEQQVVACSDPEAECAAVAAWVRDRLAADPDCQLGIVAPDLAGVRDRLSFLLDDLLHPAFIRPDAAEMPRFFNFSLGRPLADQPLVRTALALLAAAGSRAKLEQSRLSALLLASGWSAAQEEADGRALLDAAMRRDLPYFTTAGALLRLTERRAAGGASDCPQTMTALAACVEVMNAAGRRLRPGAWAAVFRRALQAAAWPGDRALSSDEFQARRSFLEVLDGFGRLDALLGAVSLADALQRLRELCRQQLFQPETRGQPRVQVLGVLESAGLKFDALWVMGMNDDLWPPAPRPNPLLPAELLRKVGAAHACAEVELDFARRVHDRLVRSAPEIVFSFSRGDGNRVLRPSPLIDELPCRDAESTQLSTPARELAALCTSAIETVADSRAPAVGAGEKVAGGSGVLRAQAICPAWAFYQFRLGAQAMETPVEGLDPRARGTLVHEALEAFWKAVRDSESLAALDAGTRSDAIERAVSEALAHFEAERRTSLPARFRVLEGQRLQRLLDVWLDYEIKRGQGFAVEATEEEKTVEVEGVAVKMVVDRIDRLADGRRVIIDYKTGATIDVNNWAAERITEPQLPIYAALVAGDVAAVVFAKVLLDKPAFSGVADEAGLLPDVAGVGADDKKQKIFDPETFPDWPAVVAHWRERLAAIAREIKEGEAGVVFADEGDLTYCDVRPLLRLPERRRLLAEMGLGMSAELSCDDACKSDNEVSQ